MLALDGLIGAFAIGALSAAFVLEPVLDNAEGDTHRDGRHGRLPGLDIVLVGLLVEAVALGGWTLSRGWAAARRRARHVRDRRRRSTTRRSPTGTYAECGLLDIGWPSRRC